jgi:two-component sensor histidine kinase
MMVLHDSTMTDSVGYLRILPDEDFNRPENENREWQPRDSIKSTPRSGYYPGYQNSRSDSLSALQNTGDSLRRNSNQISGGFRPPREERESPRPRNDYQRFRPFFIPYQVYNYFISSLFLTFFALVLRVMGRHAGIEKRQKELEKEKLNSELALLKNQISPHFFFNTLNNIYSLISINTEDSQNAVLKLSKLMRYLLYESEQRLTNLSNEIDFMNNYIDLMRLRTSNKVSLNVSFPEKTENINLPPLLFIPFIENAFKHGISYREKSFINISMKIDDENLTFNCDNSIGNSKVEKEDNHNGIGLENVRKRLKLLFPGKHTLKIERAEKTFVVNLAINIKELGNDKNNYS